ncbi:MAG: Holliday junction resolvase RuvX, partial [Oscillospiraceae bacterium]
NEYNFEKAAEKVAQTATDNKAELIVVGHPVNMNGSIGERAEKCELFKDTVQKLCGIPCVLWDERGTTITAHNILNVTDTRGKKRKNVVDAVAATIILENYLQFRRNNKENSSL